RGAASGDGGNDSNLIGFFQWRFVPFQVAHVLIIHINVNEAAQIAIFGVKVLFEIGVLRRQFVQSVAHGFSLDLQSLRLAHILPQRCWDMNCNRHRLLLPYTACSSSESKADRSSRRTHEVRSCGLPFSTLTMM